MANLEAMQEAVLSRVSGQGHFHQVPPTCTCTIGCHCQMTITSREIPKIDGSIGGLFEIYFPVTPLTEDFQQFSSPSSYPSA